MQKTKWITCPICGKKTRDRTKNFKHYSYSTKVTYYIFSAESRGGLSLWMRFYPKMST